MKYALLTALGFLVGYLAVLFFEWRYKKKRLKAIRERFPEFKDLLK